MGSLVLFPVPKSQICKCSKKTHFTVTHSSYVYLHSIDKGISQDQFTLSVERVGITIFVCDIFC